MTDALATAIAHPMPPSVGECDSPRRNLSPWRLAGLFLVSLATLMHEILLTRIFSVTLWYHFAFMAISVAMFGTALGAILVYVLPSLFPPERTRERLAASALLFALCAVGGFVACLRIPTLLLRLDALPYVALIYLVSAVPFVFSGIAVCLALTRSPREVGRLYAADLAGASFGCLFVVLTLKVTDGPTAVLVVAAMAGLGAVCFTLEAGPSRLKTATIAIASALVLGAFGHAWLVERHTPILRLVSVKGAPESPALYEKWTSFSRIRVEGVPGRARKPFGWGFSPRYSPPALVEELDITIDAASGTVLTRFDGDSRKLEYLRHDVTNIAHHLRPEARVLVIGVGGGRDLLSALAFDQRSVEGIEINEAILDALNRGFGDFAGHLDRHPKVTLVHDEARSRLARDPRRFDLLQVSLIDTWAATAAGAFALTESSLYTVEAWRTFLDRLEPRGILTFSRWYRPREPYEFYRLVNLAVVSLKARGVESPRGHLAVLTAPSGDDKPTEVGTLLVSPTPFSSDDVLRLEDLAAQMGFRSVLTPQATSDPDLARIASGEDLQALARTIPADLSAPTDDRPFFFQMVRFADLLKPGVWTGGGRERLRAVLILGVLLATVAGLAVCCLILPALRTPRGHGLRGAWPLFVFFSAIGLGFMFVELAQMQRLSLFLGHPTYSLVVVLFSLLLSSGIGSALTQTRQRWRSEPRRPLALLVLTLLVIGALTPWVVRTLAGQETPVRILASVALLFPAGLFMGTAFPLGMGLAERRSVLAPWLWGMNGAASVLASVLAVVVSMSAGISAAYWLGVCAYLVAGLACIEWARRGGQASSGPGDPQDRGGDV